MLQDQSTTVSPVCYISSMLRFQIRIESTHINNTYFLFLESNATMEYDATQLPNDVQTQQNYYIETSKKIRIKCQPRSKFRPRTRIESKTSSHYLRCEDEVESDYPAIYVRF